MSEAAVDAAVTDPMAAEFAKILAGSAAPRGPVEDAVPDAKPARKARQAKTQPVKAAQLSKVKQFSELDPKTKQRISQQKDAEAQAAAELAGAEVDDDEPGVEPFDDEQMAAAIEAETEVDEPVAVPTDDKELRVLRARLIANEMDPDAVDEMSPAVVRAVAASIGSRAQNTAASPEASKKPETVVEPGLTQPMVPPDVLKAIADHFDGDVAATLGKLVESTTKPLYDALVRMKAENAELRTVAVQSRQVEAMDNARASLVERLPELEDNAVFESIRPYMQGLATTVFKDKPMTKENLQALIVAAARGAGLREVTAESRAADKARQAAKANGQPMKGGPRGRTAMSATAVDEAAWRGMQLHMKGRIGDAQAVWQATPQ